MRTAHFTRDTYRGGAWAICDRCSQRWRRHQMIDEWDHLKVCPPCLDPRPPQMSPPDVYPEGIAFPDARPPQDNPDRLYDDSYLMAVSGGLTVTDGVYPIYANGQQAPAGAFSPQPVIVSALETEDQDHTLVQPTLADDVTLRTGPVYAPTVTGPSPGPVPGSSPPQPPFYEE